MDGGFISGSPGRDRNNPDGSQEQTTVQTLTVRMCLEAKKVMPLSPFTVNLMEITNIEILGLILEATPAPNCVVYKLDDGTGCIDVRHFWPTNESDGGHPAVKDGAYARACGTLKQSQMGKELVAFNITIVEDMNELTYHQLKIIKNYLVRTNRTIKPETFQSNVPRNANQRGRGGFSNNNNMNRGNTFNCEAEVEDAIRRLFPSHPNGVSKDVLVQHFRQKYSDFDISQALGNLETHSKLYQQEVGFYRPE